MSVLCIVQARLKSTRIENKMLLKLGGETLIARAWRVACEAFGAECCVVAIPTGDWNGPLGEELRRIGASVYLCNKDENDVVWRFYMACIDWMMRTCVKDTPLCVRYTPDDYRKSAEALRQTADGHVLPIEIGGEAFSFRDLLTAQITAKGEREHVTYAIAGARRLLGEVPIRHPAPPNDGLPWTIDTPEQYAAACARYERERVG